MAVMLRDSATTESLRATQNGSPLCINGPRVKPKPIT